MSRLEAVAIAGWCNGACEPGYGSALAESHACEKCKEDAGRVIDVLADPDDRMVEAAARVIDPDVFPPQPQTGQKTLSQWYAFAPGRVEGRAVAITKAKAAISAAMKAAGE